MRKKPKAFLTKTLIYDPNDRRCDDCGYVNIWVGHDPFGVLIASRYSKEDCENDIKHRGYDPVLVTKKGPLYE